MTEHRIRLRAAWERLGPGPGESRRVDLPALWDEPAGSGMIRLRRGFGLPRVDPGGAILLELVDVPGLVEARLNGAALGPVDREGDAFRVEVGGRLDRRNVLELDVEPAAAGEGPWGSVALVVVGGTG